MRYVRQPSPVRRVRRNVQVRSRQAIDRRARSVRSPAIPRRSARLIERQATANRTIARDRAFAVNRSGLNATHLLRTADLPTAKVVTKKLSSSDIKKINDELKRQGIIRQLDLQSLPCMLNLQYTSFIAYIIFKLLSLFFSLI